MQLALLVCLTVLAWPAAARATVYPGQEPLSSPFVDDVISRAEVFWRLHGVVACVGGVTAWEAPRLVDGDGDAWGRGDGSTCEIWLSQSLVHNAVMPLWVGDAIETCTAVTHEVGHAYGLGHTSKGVMAGAGAPARLFGWAPRFCWPWARAQVRALLRGEGNSELAIERAIRYQMRLIRG